MTKHATRWKFASKAEHVVTFGDWIRCRGVYAFFEDGCDVLEFCFHCLIGDTPWAVFKRPGQDRFFFLAVWMAPNFTREMIETTANELATFSEKDGIFWLRSDDGPRA